MPNLPRNGTSGKTDRPVEINERTISRRSVVDWLGKSAVLALGADLVAACAPLVQTSPDGRTNLDASDGGDSNRLGETGPGGDASSSGKEAGPDAGTGDFPFQPTDGAAEIYQDWPIRTVDRQNLETVLSSWTLRVDGLVGNPVSLSFGELVALERQDQVVDFHCVEGWSVYDVPWNGVHLSTLLDLVSPNEGATHVTFHTLGGRYNESLPIDVALEPRTLLAYGVAGNTLPLPHGFPLRLVVPRLLAYKSAKYVERIELTNHPVSGYWVAAGYPYSGEVPEARLREGRY